jgi:hypothetical protein
MTAPAAPPVRREPNGLGEELRPYIHAGGTEGSAESDLGAPLKHTDHHHVGDPDSADKQGHRTERETQSGISVLSRHASHAVRRTAASGQS